MSRFSDADEVLTYLRDKYGPDADGDTHALALFTYAVVEDDRLSWAEHIHEQTSVAPTEAETQAWFQSKPPKYFLEKERLAEQWFLSVARIVLADEIESLKQEAIRETIGDLRRFWPGFMAGNLAGVTSNFLFALLIVLFLAIVDTNFSIIDWAKRLLGSH
jgi:hypothetical protein